MKEVIIASRFAKLSEENKSKALRYIRVFCNNSHKAGKLKYVPIDGIDIGAYSRRLIGSDTEGYLNCVIDAIAYLEARTTGNVVSVIDKTNEYSLRILGMQSVGTTQGDILGRWYNEDDSLSNEPTVTEVSDGAVDEGVLAYLNDPVLGGDSPEEGISSEESIEDMGSDVTEDFHKDSQEDKEVEEEKEEEEEEEDTTSRDLSEKELRDSIKMYFGMTIQNRINMIMRRYDLLFKSGYDLERPYGIITEPDKVLFIDSECVLKERSNPERDIDKNSSGKLYDLIEQKVGFGVSDSRSASKISQDFLIGIHSGCPLIYFPFKMLEYAFGRNPSREESTTYKYATVRDDKGKVQGVSTNWELFKGKIEKDVKLTIEDSVLAYCVEELGKPKDGEASFSESEKQAVDRFLGFVSDSLSICLLITGYKSTNSSPAELRLRVCDPRKNFSDVRIDSLINKVFSGYSGGSQGTSLNSSLNVQDSSELGVYELNHEFDHELSNALPLFAYRAYEHLRDNNEEISFDRLVLGRCEDGTILRNGTHGVDLSSTLFHNITAGSRSGKGVMTLNLLVGAILSNKAIFYLDNKPDMASMLNQLAGGEVGGNLTGPSFFTVNGGNFKDDTQQQFVNVNSWINKERIPLEAVNILGEPCWRGGNESRHWGGLFYLRAYMFIMGMIFARASSNNAKFKDPRYNGEDGFFVVCDEINELMNEVMGTNGLVSKLTNRLPFHKNAFKSTVLDMERAKEKADSGDKKSSDKFENLLSSFTNNFGADRYYSLALFSSFVESIDYIYGMTNSGFNKSELKYSDIFLIGQNLEGRPMDLSTMREVIGAERKIRVDAGNGANKSVVSELNEGGVSLPFAMFKFGSTDGIFGYNADYPKYFGCNPEDAGKSRAYPRLDEISKNFCYTPKFSMSTSKSNTGNVSDALTIGMGNAGSTVYFKPYLILNDSSDTYTSQLFNMSKAPKEAIIAEYPDENDKKKLSRYVGFPEYLSLMSISDVPSRLRKGYDIANMVVGEVLKYPDDGSGRPLWLQFITDLRPEWLFSIRDIAEACISDGRTVKVGSLDNPLITEYKEYIDFLSKHSDWSIRDATLSSDTSTYVDDDGNVQYDMTGYESDSRVDLYDDDDDLNSEQSRVREGARFDSCFAEDDNGYDEDEELDFNSIFGTSEPLNQNTISSPETVFTTVQSPVQRYTPDTLLVDGMNSPVNASTQDDNIFVSQPDEGNRVFIDPFEQASRDMDGGQFEQSTSTQNPQNQGNLNQNTPLQSPFDASNGAFNSPQGARGSDIDAFLAELSARNSTAQEPVGYSVDSNRQGVNCGFDRPQSSQVFDTNSLRNLQFSSRDENSAVQTIAHLMKLISLKVIDTYGGFDRVATLAVSGGAIVINGTVFRSTIDESAVGTLPLDVRRQLRSGNIASLFDFTLLKKMPRLSTLSFDSESFVYSYVRLALRYKSLGINNFFDDLRGLMILKVGNNTFHRNTYKQDIKANDIFYYQSCGTKFAKLCDRNMSKFTKSSWSFTKNMFNSRDHGFIVKSLGVLGGLTASAVAGTVALGSKAAGGISGQVDRHTRVSRGFSGFKQSVKDLFNE